MKKLGANRIQMAKERKKWSALPFTPGYIIGTRQVLGLKVQMKNTKKVQNQFEKAVEESVASQHEEFELNPVLIVN